MLLCRLWALTALGRKAAPFCGCELADRPEAAFLGFTQEAEGLLFGIPGQSEELKQPGEKACLPAAPNRAA